MDNLPALLIDISIGIMLLAIFISTIRFLKGPSLSDRTIAFDGITIITISLIVVLSLIFERIIYLDVALLYGLLSYLGVLVVTRFIERGL